MFISKLLKKYSNNKGEISIIMITAIMILIVMSAPLILYHLRTISPDKQNIEIGNREEYNKESNDIKIQINGDNNKNNIIINQYIDSDK